MSSLIKQSVRQMQGYVPGEQPDDPSVIKLNTNENPYPPSSAVSEILKELDCGCLRKYPDPVCSDLREAIANLHGCHSENVFVGNGSDEVLALAIGAFVERSGSIGYFDPSYSLYPVLADIADIEKRPVALGDDFSWRMPDDYRSSLFFLTNPNAPTSILYERETIANFVRDFPGVVVIDEAYADFASRNCVDLWDSFDNLLIARTLSKSYSLAGIRLGYCLGPRPLIAALYKIKDSYNLDLITQKIGLAAILDQETMHANLARIKRTRERVADALRKLNFEVFPSETNFLWIKPSRESAKQLFQRLKRENIFTRHFDDARTADYLRVTIGNDAEMDAFLEALAPRISKKHQHTGRVSNL